MLNQYPHLPHGLVAYPHYDLRKNVSGLYGSRSALLEMLGQSCGPPSDTGQFVHLRCWLPLLDKSVEIYSYRNPYLPGHTVFRPPNIRASVKTYC